jgi:hypothetical protein
VTPEVVSRQPVSPPVCPAGGFDDADHPEAQADCRHHQKVDADMPGVQPHAVPAQMGRRLLSGLAVPVLPARDCGAAVALPPEAAQVMRQAVDALESALCYIDSASWSPDMPSDCREAIDALRAVLEGEKKE